MFVRCFLRAGSTSEGRLNPSAFAVALGNVQLFCIQVREGVQSRAVVLGAHDGQERPFATGDQLHYR